MKVKSTVKSGGLRLNHNGAMSRNDKESLVGNKNLKKLQLKKETIKILKDSDLKNIAGGLPKWTYTICGSCGCP